MRLEITAAPLMAWACHCDGCQRMTASAFSLTLTIPQDGFAVLAGEPVIGGLHGASRHYFCPHCLTWSFTRPAGMDEVVNVRATMLDDHGWFVPFVDVWREQKLACVESGAPHRFDTEPSDEEFPALMEAYGREGARPA